MSKDESLIAEKRNISFVKSKIYHFNVYTFVEVDRRRSVSEVRTLKDRKCESSEVSHWGLLGEPFPKRKIYLNSTQSVHVPKRRCSESNAHNRIYSSIRKHSSHRLYSIQCSTSVKCVHWESLFFHVLLSKWNIFSAESANGAVFPNKISQMNLSILQLMITYVLSWNVIIIINIVVKITRLRLLRFRFVLDNSHIEIQDKSMRR